MRGNLVAQTNLLLTHPLMTLKKVPQNGSLTSREVRNVQTAEINALMSPLILKRDLIAQLSQISELHEVKRLTALKKRKT